MQILELCQQAWQMEPKQSFSVHYGCVALPCIRLLWQLILCLAARFFVFGTNFALTYLCACLEYISRGRAIVRLRRSAAQGCARFVMADVLVDDASYIVLLDGADITRACFWVSNIFNTGWLID